MMKKIKNIFWIAIFVAIIVSFIYKVAVNSFTDHFMGDSPQRTKAVLINEKNYMGNQPVDPKFSYSYQFIVNGEKYKGDAHDISLNIGDTVEIEYNQKYPFINKPLNPKQ